MASVSTSLDQPVVLRDVGWETYEKLLADLTDSSAPRLTFDRGTLEITSPTAEHERLNRLIASFVEEASGRKGGLALRRRKRGTTSRELTHVMDLMPTFLEVAGARFPESYSGNRIAPLQGMSPLPLLEGATPAAFVDREIGWEAYGMDAYRRGHWKIPPNHPSYGFQRERPIGLVAPGVEHVPRVTNTALLTHRMLGVEASDGHQYLERNVAPGRLENPYPIQVVADPLVDHLEMLRPYEIDFVEHDEVGETDRTQLEHFEPLVVSLSKDRVGIDDTGDAVEPQQAFVALVEERHHDALGVGDPAGLEETNGRCGRALYVATSVRVRQIAGH